MQANSEQEIVRLTRNRIILRVNGEERAFRIEPAPAPMRRRRSNSLPRTQPRRDNPLPRTRRNNSIPRSRPRRQTPSQTVPEYLRQAAQMPRVQIRLDNLTAQNVQEINNLLRPQQLIRAINIGSFSSKF